MLLRDPILSLGHKYSPHLQGVNKETDTIKSRVRNAGQSGYFKTEVSLPVSVPREAIEWHVNEFDELV